MPPPVTLSAPAATPATSNVALSETGATELYPLMNQWVPAYHSKYPNVSISTGATGSGAGISQAAAGTVNIGASGAYLSDGDMSAHKGLMNIALAVSAEQVNYNLPGVSAHLKLNGKVLAAMYQGTIKTWNDPQIAALNPGVNLPGHRRWFRCTVPTGPATPSCSPNTCRSKTPTAGASHPASAPPSTSPRYRARWVRTAPAAW